MERYFKLRFKHYGAEVRIGEIPKIVGQYWIKTDPEQLKEYLENPTKSKIEKSYQIPRKWDTYKDIFYANGPEMVIGQEMEIIELDEKAESVNEFNIIKKLDDPWELAGEDYVVKQIDDYHSGVSLMADKFCMFNQVFFHGSWETDIIKTKDSGLALGLLRLDWTYADGLRILTKVSYDDSRLNLKTNLTEKNKIFYIIEGDNL